MPAVAAVAPAQTYSGCGWVNLYQDWDTHIAHAICKAENPSEDVQATSRPNWDGSVDRGLMQVNSTHADMVGGDLNSLYNPSVNVRVAHSLWTSPQGWTHWTTYNSGKYRLYL